ncbi:MAG TPA: hypothetical protein VMR75_03690 [Candidatus Saccharimonadales bacterium]|nr:hypothetical protein [Candidatus Saccharimonadales bacterium]
MRRAISCTLAPLIVTLALLVAPAPSLAESPEPCTAACPAPAQTMVEATLIPDEGNILNAPELPHGASNASFKLENSYFDQLTEIVGSICETVVIGLENGAASRSLTGFTGQLTVFNMARHRLDRLLEDYKLGPAPTITGFSHVIGLHIVLKNKEETGNSLPACIYKLV